jgi:eukaryotic-like serine/threonine-protein kinase
MSDSAQRPSQLPREGSLFAGRYKLEARLASGGMGAVYRATDTTGQVVAIKVLHPELASDSDIRRRFRRESSILHAIQHPGVVRILDTGTDDKDRSYTVMELLSGETLDQRIARLGRIPIAELVPIIEQVADALTVVHEHGVVHGDLKPANVFLVVEDGKERAKLVDFGLSKVHGLDRLTRTGEVIGTPGYMAPELLTGEGTPDGRIDGYALGVILYEAISGKQPFTERNPGRLMFEIVMGRATPLDEAAPEAGERVARVVERAMAKGRDERFETPADLARAFAEAAQAA